MVGVGAAVGLGASDPFGGHELKLNRSGASDQLADTEYEFLPFAHLADIETQGWGICSQGSGLKTAEGKKTGGMEKTVVIPCLSTVPAQKSEKGRVDIFSDDVPRSL